MGYTNPSISDFQTYFARDFNFGTEQNTVTNNDITSAMQDAAYFVNPALFGTQAGYTVGFLDLSAHFLVMNLRASSQGVGGNYPWPTNSKAVGSVSDSFQIPDVIMNNPAYAMLTKTYYGAKYFFMIYASLRGQIYTVCSQPNP